MGRRRNLEFVCGRNQASVLHMDGPLFNPPLAPVSRLERADRQAIALAPDWLCVRIALAFRLPEPKPQAGPCVAADNCSLDRPKR